eukprot:g61580.t1
MKQIRLISKRANATAQARVITGAKRRRSVCNPTKHARLHNKDANALAQARATIGAKQHRSVCHPSKRAQNFRFLVGCCTRRPHATSSLTVSGMVELTHMSEVVNILAGK